MRFWHFLKQLSPIDVKPSPKQTETRFLQPKNENDERFWTLSFNTAPYNYVSSPFPLFPLNVTAETLFDI